jgi:hypothetical protein
MIMYARGCIAGYTMTSFLALAATLLVNSLVAQQQAPTTNDEIEILTRGPVHEAFAETIIFDPEPGLVIPKYPPAAIDELPPESQPEGDNVAWIPGYWAWDDDRQDFLWVSGVWRSIPPERQWIPGYWAPVGKGAQWTSGYWADANSEDIEYLPEPPATVEAGPNSPAPSAEYRWLPGCWIWKQNGYVWRPGYWTPGRDDWNWIPSRYVWTPRGYVFVDGYFDYNVDRRGVLYAPVYFKSNIYTQRSFSYSPATIINPSVFVNHLFLRPNYGHYYFGDYYGANYVTRGFSPWISYHNRGSGYDPFYAQQGWQNRADQQWKQRMESAYARRRDNELERPPHDLRSQRERFTRDKVVDDSFRVGTTVEELAQAKALRQRFQAIAPQTRQQLGKRGQEIRALNEQRLKLESEIGDRAGGQENSARNSTRSKFPRSTIVGTPIQKLPPGKAPPKATAAPPPDPGIQPKPRPQRGNKENPPKREKTKAPDEPGKGGKDKDKEAGSTS